MRESNVKLHLPWQERKTMPLSALLLCLFHPSFLQNDRSEVLEVVLEVLEVDKKRSVLKSEDPDT